MAKAVELHAERQLKKKLLLIDREIKIRMAAVNLRDFIEFCMSDPDHPEDSSKSRFDCQPHHQVIIDLFQDVESGKNLRAALSIQPQSGKTTIVSLYGTAWALARNPLMNIIVGTYSESRAEQVGEQVRSIINSARFKAVFPDFELRKGSKAKDYLGSKEGGGILFRGRGSATTGNPCDLFIIDDPIKDHMEANSPAVQAQTWEWYCSVVFSRLHTLSRIFILHCLTGDTSISMSDGTRKPISEIKKGDMVLSLCDGEVKAAKVLNHAAVGVDDILELKTGNNTVRGNGKHPFLVIRDTRMEWIKLRDLKKGDKIVSIKKTDYQKEKILNKDRSWLLGYMFGDGWVTFGKKKCWDKIRKKYYSGDRFATCCATGVHADLNNKFLKIMKSEFGIIPKRTKFGYYRTEIASIGKWMVENKCFGGAKNKRFPEYIFSLPVQNRKAFLRGFADADGNFIAKHKRWNIASSSHEMIKDLRHLARSCGYSPSNVHVSKQMVKPPHSKKIIESIIYKFSYQEKIKEKDIDFSWVRSVTPVGREMVYDIQVEGSENFIADGLVVHNTRWCENDLIGRQCDPDHTEYDPSVADKWTYINLPAIIEDQDLADTLGIAVGEPLWKKRFSLELLNEAKKQNPETFSALYMGKPVPDEGNFFKQEMIVEYSRSQLPENLKIYATSDHALSKKTKADSTVLLIFGVDAIGNIWLLDCVWKKLDPLECVEEMCRLMEKWTPMTWWAGRDHITGTLGPFLTKRMQERRIFKTWVQPVSEKGDKQQKAQSIRGRMGMGMVRFPKEASWFAKAKLEVLKFDKAGHDDFVDAISIIGRQLDTMYGAQLPVDKKDEAPKTGTFAWVKWSSGKRDIAMRAEKARAGW